VLVGGGAPSEVRAFLGLGSNLGDRARALAEAARRLSSPDLRIVRRSRIYESPPWGKTDQPPFLNQVAAVETSLPPRALLLRCHDVEQALGRVRAERWGPRTIDVDVLLYDDLVVETPDLVVPHAEMHRRSFVLVPLAEIAPGLRFPNGETVEALLQRLPDREAVRPFASEE
jgi:2-amino-4-hydroxy-6-hydroxymethyldihydropteridine diphosphokinase